MTATLHLLEEERPRRSFAQQVQDHESLLAGYLDTHITRNHSELTRLHEERFLYNWFRSHSEDDGPLFAWKAMEPVLGRERVVAYATSLIKDRRVGARTLGTYLGILRRFFGYLFVI